MFLQTDLCLKTNAAFVAAALNRLASDSQWRFMLLGIRLMGALRNGFRKLLILSHFLEIRPQVQVRRREDEH